VAVDFPPNRNEVCGNRHRGWGKRLDELQGGNVRGITGLKANILWVAFDGCSNKI